ncbi:MAG: hypothetical protein U5R14_02615 [Gemmatimonadota bacterium]|nr:hypothetical protein [Gemmatimonadota bacterium]
MSLLSRFFRSKTGPDFGPEELESRLQTLEEEASGARPGHQGTPLNKAGDLALRAGYRARAVEYYGRAIDSFLEDQQREAARGVANKIIRVHPKAVRTLCTLTWLDLAARHKATALLHLRDYVEAAHEIGEHDRAARQILEMARVAPQMEFVDAVADALDGLDFDERATEVREWARSGGSPDVLNDDDVLAEHCVRAAVDSAKG